MKDSRATAVSVLNDMITDNLLNTGEKGFEPLTFGVRKKESI